MMKKISSALDIAWQYVFFILIWCGFLGSIDAITLLSGCFFVLLLSFLFSFSSQKIKIHYLFILIFYILYKLFESSYYVILEILKPRRKSEYKIETVNFNRLTKTQMIILSNLISLTPGTLTVDLTDSSVIIHDMFPSKDNCIIDSIVNQLIPMIKRAFP